MTTFRRVVCAVLCGLAPPLHAGHGFMNSFADVEWFPDPGTTPDELSYVFDRGDERFALLTASSDEQQFVLCLQFMKEKLAEAAAMVKTHDVDAARVALSHYDEYLARATDVVATLAGKSQATYRGQLIDALLEHIYLVTVDYVDMPLEVRTIMSSFFADGMKRYEVQRDALPKGSAEALFFKEEEVRWSIEMTRQADEQGIVN